MTDEDVVRQQVRKEFEVTIEDCIGSIRSYLATFDELHILVDAKNLSDRVTALCETQARKAHRIIRAYLESLCPNHPDLVEDHQYPLLETLLANHLRIANQIITKTQQGKAQGKDDDDIIDFVWGYMERAFKHASDAVIFYEATRVIADDTLSDAPEGAFFRTVCQHDDRTCQVCLDIEAEQAKHPVPISDKLTGTNAPPFHPFCRCHVEVIV